MLIYLITILFLGSGATPMLAYIGDTQDSVKLVVTEDERRKEALSTLKAMKKRTTAHNRTVRRARKNIEKELRQDNTSDAGIDTIWAAYFVEFDDYDRDILDLRFELKEHIIREEWEAIFPVD
jgi:hypothetical protein